MLLETCYLPLIGPDLFVFFSCRTRGGEPLLSDDEIQQAAYQAIGTRTRLLLCRLLAIESTETRIFMVFRFPASLSISDLARGSMQAAEEAISRLQQILYARPQSGQPFWEREYILETMSTQESAQPVNYLRQRVEAIKLLPLGS